MNREEPLGLRDGRQHDTISRCEPSAGTSASSRLRCAQNVLNRDLLTLAPEFVAAAPTTSTLQDAGTDQLLQDRLKMARWKPIARQNRLRRDRTPIAMDSNVQDDADGE
jgi:hypothetical protein